MHVISGKHKSHTARLLHFAGDRLTADCSTCQARQITLKPSMVQLTAPEAARMRESYENYLRGGTREGGFWESWKLTEGGMLAIRAERGARSHDQQ